MKFVVSPAFSAYSDAVRKCIQNFWSTGKVLASGRNTIRIFDIDGLQVNIKAFKLPNLVNRFAYSYFRKSKAQRSFEFATKLLQMGIGTPKPIAYSEHTNWSGLRESFYASEHLDAKLTYRELVEIPDYPDRDNILRQFTRFSYKLHELGIEFKDHSPGNTLILEDAPGQYSFYLVDLNRMEFHDKMPFELRMKNLSRLTPHKEMVATMSNEYAKASAEDETVIFETLWRLTAAFQHRFHRKRRLKKKFLFRK
nr:lipopolysaccharide kinase InaA family protein [Flavobacterium silvaticum]